MQILYEDNHLIAALKKPGQLTQGDATGDLSLFAEVKSFIKQRDHKPGNVFLGLLHRLDRPVGGVVLFAKTSKAASRLSAQIREHTIEKTYEALVEGTPPQEGRVRQWLRKDRKRNVVQAFDHPVRGALPAELFFRCREAGEISRVEIIPVTGRPHQIRVAMASLDTPIVGDFKYGAHKPWHGQIALYATGLSFNHPIKKHRLDIRADSPLR